MDEEDLAEMQEGRKLVDEHEEMEFGGTAAEKRRQAGEADDQECVCVRSTNIFLVLMEASALSLPFSPLRLYLHRRTQSVPRS